MLQFSDLLIMEGIDLDEVNIALHSHSEKDFKKVLPTLFATHPAAFRCFQSSHSTQAERSLKKGRAYLASFVRVKNSRLVFTGIDSINGWRERTAGEIWREPDIAFLMETYGMDYGQNDAAAAEKPNAWFDLRPTELLTDLRGRLLIETRLTPAYMRLAERLDAPVVAILEEGVHAAPPPEWNSIHVSAPVVRALPPGWAAKLAELRGIYLIVDESDGKRYVGSAYGEENMLGRWRAHVAGDAGVTKELKRRDPINFRFSILQLLAPDAEPREVIELERNWMERLHTREFGLNA